MNSNEITRLKFDYVLHQIGKLDDAEKHMLSLLNDFSNDHLNTSDAYYVLGVT